VPVLCGKTAGQMANKNAWYNDRKRKTMVLIM